MTRYILKRILQLIVVLLGVTFLTFLVTMAAPSDAAEMRYLSKGFTPSEELLEQTREELGLHDPVLVQYGRWLGRLAQGDLGNSYNTDNSVLLEITRKLPGTLMLAGSSLLLMLLFEFPLGLITAVYQNKPVDYFLRIISFVGISMPNFWLALLLMFFLAVRIRWFPVIGRGDLNSMILPMLTLAIPMICDYIRQIRTAILEELEQAYVTGARARGVAESRILFCHVLPNALVPIVTLIGLSIGHLLGGAAIVETIFSWQGIGNMVVEAIRNRDYPVIQAYVIWMAVIYVMVNLTVDIACHIMDPKLRRKGVH
ncbi:MAG: ABC transporter permease [Lachnospiraceae bacterium]|nr:ABC transporter permease [Lachnospiraceae bacterium]